jgi:hypothetical protein
MQNQTLNAILFLFRHVLGKEIGDLGDTVRAERDKNLQATMIYTHVASKNILCVSSPLDK